MQLHCPNCGSALNIVTRQGIEIDVCPSCGGVWLDHGELDKIVSRSAEQHHRSYHGEGIYTDDVQKRKRGKPRRKKDERYEARYRDDDRRRRDDDDDRRRRYDDDDDDDDKRRSSSKKRWKRRKRDFIEDLFDIFD